MGQNYAVCRIWRKLHIGIDSSGEIIAGSLTTLHDSDIREVPNLFEQITGALLHEYYTFAYFPLPQKLS